MDALAEQRSFEEGDEMSWRHSQCGEGLLMGSLLASRFSSKLTKPGVHNFERQFTSLSINFTWD